MEFKRKKKRGYSQKTRRFWFSEDDYRIVWRCEAFGIELPPRFQATVRLMLPDGREMWDFVSSRRLFKTLKAAQDACEKHRRLWTKAAEATGIRNLEELFGKVPFGYPAWVKSRLNRNVYGLLMDTSTRKRKDIEICDPAPDALTRISDCSASPTEAIDEIPGPASLVAEPELLTTGFAKPAEQAAREPKRRASKRTAKSGKVIGKPRKTTKRLPASEGRPSESSRKKKSRRSSN